MPNTHKQVAYHSKIKNKQSKNHDHNHVHEISGWLEKQRRVRGWVWKKYWFVLDGDQLGYYKQPDDQVILCSDLSGRALYLQTMTMVWTNSVKLNATSLGSLLQNI